MTALNIPDTIAPRDGATDFSAYAIEDIRLDFVAHNRIRVSQSDALRATQFGMANEDTTYEWGLVTAYLYQG